MQMVAEKLAGFSRNRFQVTCNSQSTNVPAGSTIEFTLPTSATLDLTTLRFHMDIDCSGGAICPVVEDLVQAMSVYVGGTCVVPETAEFNTISRMYGYANTSLDRASSIGKTVGNYLGDTSGNLDLSLVYIPPIGLLGGECSSQLFPAFSTGAVTIRLRLASNNVLSKLGSDTSTNQKYTLKKITSTIDSISMGASGAFEQLLMSQLETQPIELTFFDYQSFSMGNVAPSAFTHTITLSSGSVNKLLLGVRDSDYTDESKDQIAYGVSGTSGATGYDNDCSNYMYFQSLSKDIGTTGLENGDAKAYWQVSGVRYPQTEGIAATGAVCDLALFPDRQRASARGILISGLGTWHCGKALWPLILNYSNDVGLRSGFDSRGAATTISCSVSGLDNTNKKGTGSTYNSFIAAQVSSVLRIGANKAVSVEI